MALTDNLVAYYKLDEASGNATDALGANDLTNTNGVTAATGKVSGARSFAAASSQYLTHASNASFVTGDIDFTVAGWVNPTTTGSFPVIANKGWAGSGSTREWILYINGTPQFEFSVEKADGSGSAAVQWGTGPSTSTWYHVVAWHDSVNNQLCIAVNNGTPVTSSYSAGVSTGTGAFQLGRSEGQSIFWNGLIDEFGFWKRVLTSGERTSLYNGGNGFAYPFSSGAGWYYDQLLRAG